ncbi:MAG: hypothetical protein KatS3mg115_1398 [Candidatus Poribacteria bacterium]|nr:MAG: hypothetical protein KatS3mg115_1398 [Candidatus Poribacteria bacterium]
MRKSVVGWLLGMSGLLVGALAQVPEPVFYLPLDEGAGEVTFDQIGGAEGRIVGDVQWTTGYRGAGLEFGGNGYVEFEPLESLDLTEAISFVGWILPTSAPADTNLWGRRTAANVGGYTMQWTAGKVETWLWLGAWTGTRGLQTIQPTLNVWHFVASTYDGSTIRQYVDGELDIEIPGGGPFQSVAETFRVGQAQTGLPAMPGIMDEIAIFDEALSADQLKRIRQHGTPLPVRPQERLALLWATLKQRGR